ncbi:MAG: DUF4389 domain-containing protein [Pseudomonadota bacterium]
MNEPSSSSDKNEITQHLTSKSIWMRLVFMLIVTFFYSISRIVVVVIALVQFLWKLFTGDINEKLLGLGKSLATYTNQIILYLTFNTEERPFPFDLNWPE